MHFTQGGGHFDEWNSVFILGCKKLSQLISVQAVDLAGEMVVQQDEPGNTFYIMYEACRELMGKKSTLSWPHAFAGPAIPELVELVSENNSLYSSI